MKSVSRREFIKATAGSAALVAGLALSSCVPPVGNLVPGKRPNIILIMADDMGFSDIGCYGSEIQTPVLDKLASDGVKFTQFYNAARCCPSRASLLTGLYPHQTGVGHMTRDYEKPAYTGDLNNNCVTIAEALGSSGYQTMMSGKWHVTKQTGHWDGSEYTSKAQWPLQRGFQKFYGFIHGSSSYFDPVLTRDNEPFDSIPDDIYLTNAISENAVNYISEAARADEPYFMYVSYNAPHWPLHALPEDIEKYRGRYSGGWDELRNERYKKQVELGLVDEKWGLSPRDPEVEDWDDVDNKEWQERRMEVYAAMIDRMDQGIGKILDQVKDSGEEDNTLIMFLADNGGSPETIKNPRKFYVPRETSDGRFVHRGTNPEIMPGADDTFQSYGIGWANASNSPFRLFKRWVHEGGIASPFIMKWPKTVKNYGGMVNGTGHVMDIMATCLDAAGVSYPQQFNGNKITPMEGQSMLPMIRGENDEIHDFVCWEHEGNRAIKQGKWKLTSYYTEPRQRRVSKGDRTGEWELFNLEADRIELYNLAEQNPEKVAELVEIFDKWSERMEVISWEEIQEINTALLSRENK